MRRDSHLAGIGATLQKFQRMEQWLRKAGLPGMLAQLPLWLLCLHYCLMLRGKTTRIAAIAARIHHWLESITALSRNEHARTDLIDMDSTMRDDIESTKRTLRSLRDLCVDVGAMFDSVGCRSRMLLRGQRAFLAVVDDAWSTATRLQQALASHDALALALLRQMHAEEQAAARADAEAVQAAAQMEADMTVQAESCPAAQPALPAPNAPVQLAQR